MIHSLRRNFAFAWKKWNYFWFDSMKEENLFTLSVFRIVFSLVMFFFYLSRTPDLKFFYSDQGIITGEFLQSLDLFKYNWGILFHYNSLQLIYLLHGIFLVSIFLVMVGFLTPVSSAVAYFLHLTFLHRNMTVMFGCDMIGTFYFLYMCFAKTNREFSLDARLGFFQGRQRWIQHIAFRLMQIQICVVYWYAGLEKLKGVRWWDGSALWDVLSISDMIRWDMSFVAHLPFLLAIGSYSVILWEMFFPFMVWRPVVRLPYLTYGVLMHIGIIVFLNLPGFGLLMMSTYVLFLKKKEIVGIFKTCRLPYCLRVEKV